MAWTDKLATTAARLAPESLRRPRWFRPRYPLVAVEIREDGIVAVRLERRRGAYRLAGYGARRVDAGVYSASVMSPAISDPAALTRALTEVLRLAGAEGANRISLALPDTAARVFIVDVGELPPAQRQAEEVIRFRIRKSIPFRPEDARLSWDVLGRGEDGRLQVLVAVTPEPAIRPLETLITDMGIRCGLVDLATLGVFNALRLDGRIDGAVEDVALLNATPTYFSLLLLRGGRVIFFRAKGYHAQGGFRGAESIEAVQRELRSTVGYYAEHLLGEGIQRTLVRVAGVPADELAAVVQDAGCGETYRAEMRTIVPELARMAPDAVGELLPAVGLALRRHA